MPGKSRNFSIALFVKRGAALIERGAPWQIRGIKRDGYFEECKPLVCKNKGSEYEGYADRLIETKTTNSVRPIGALLACRQRKVERRKTGAVSTG